MENSSFEMLRNILSENSRNGRFALAYSGGLDSRFLAHTARLLGFSPLLMHVIGPHVPPEESEFARSWASELALEFKEIPVNPLSLSSVSRGDKDRCYACKLAMFSALAAVSDLPLYDGTNASDSRGYRPGLRAVRELGIVSPLALAGLTKNDIHFLAESTGMTMPWQPPRPCLLTRLPYGTRPTEETLSVIAAGEKNIRQTLLHHGMPRVDFRIRLVTPDRTELHLLRSDAADMSDALKAQLLRQAGAAMPGYPRPVLSLQDSLSGFFDKITA